jgi:hypothetical protein
MKLFAFASLMAVLTSGISAAQDMQPSSLKLTQALDTPRAQELQDLFVSVCVGKYPDETAVAENVKQSSGAPLSEESLRAVLYEGDGRGWLLRGKSGPFIVLLKAAPNRNCTVLSAADAPFAPVQFRKTVGDALAAKKLGLMPEHMDFDRPQPDGGIAHTFSSLGTGAPPELYLMIVQDHPQRAQNKFETRLVRSLRPVN